MAYTFIRAVPMTLVEMPTFIRQADAVLSEDEKTALLTSIGERPDAGTIMDGTGGVRKLRWSMNGKGKSGGVRVVYYYHSDAMPIIVITLFPKNVKANLSKTEKNQIKKLVQELVKSYPEGRGKPKWPKRRSR